MQWFRLWRLRRRAARFERKEERRVREQAGEAVALVDPHLALPVMLDAPRTVINAPGGTVVAGNVFGGVTTISGVGATADCNCGCGHKRHNMTITNEDDEKG